MLTEIRLAVRVLAKSPGFTAAAILTLALTLGANSAVFSLVNAVLIRPLLDPADRPLVSLFTANQEAAREFRLFSYSEYEVLRAPNDVFSDVAATIAARVGLSPAPGSPLQRSLVHLITENGFHLLDAAPAAGRAFSSDETRPGADQAVAVASHALWQRLGGRADFLGSTLWLNGHACTIVGIMPAGFTGTASIIAPELWLPLGLYGRIGSTLSRATGQDDLRATDHPALMLTARLHQGHTLATARQRLPALAEELTRLQPAGTNSARELVIEPPTRFGPTAQPSDGNEAAVLATPLLFMAASVLLIACLNLANMLLARGAARAKEIAVRLALGSTRWRIIRHLLVEGLVLAVAGGALGLIFSVWANHTLVAVLDTAVRTAVNATINLRPEIDLTVLGFTFLACVVATLLFSLAPALRASRRDVVNDLKTGGSAPQADRWNRFFAGRHVLVMTQVALSIVLLFSAGLFLRGAMRAHTIVLGFSPGSNLVTVIDYALLNLERTQAQRSLDTVLTRIAALPGVRSAAVSTQAPMGNTEINRRVDRADASPKEATTGAPPPGVRSLFNGISPGYFSTLGIPLLRGRDFTHIEAREAAAPRVAILDASLAHRLFPDGDALGQLVRFSASPSASEGEEWEVIGIVGEHRHEYLQVEPTHIVFVPLVHGLGGSSYLHTRLDGIAPGKEATVLAATRAELRQIDPQLPVLRHEPLVTFIRDDFSLWCAQLGAVVFGLFGAIALFLSVLGVYSVEAYAVSRRTREIGIRVALGARPSDILALIIKQGMAHVAVASAAGLVLALLAGQALTALLFHVSAADPWALGGAVAILSLAALLACYIPSRRAARVTPTTAFRAD